MPRQHLGLTTQFPTCQLNRHGVEWGSNRDRLCSNPSLWPLYHITYACYLPCWWKWWLPRPALDWSGLDWTTWKSLVKRYYNIVDAKLLIRQLPCKKAALKNFVHDMNEYIDGLLFWYLKLALRIHRLFCSQNIAIHPQYGTIPRSGDIASHFGIRFLWKHRLINLRVSRSSDNFLFHFRHAPKTFHKLRYTLR